MKVIGIVAEYNPLHAGHALHLKKTRESFGEDSAVVCAMSGDFVQRGDLALYNKFARAEAACRSGIDLVVELPLPWCISSAEHFAQGAVGLLAGLGVQVISFGSEEGRVERLEKTAKLLLEPCVYEQIKALQQERKELPFAAARQQVMEALLPDCCGILEKPNNILAVEYLKAIARLGGGIQAVTVARVGSGHDQKGSVGPKSASELRSMRAEETDIAPYVPRTAEDVYRRERQQGREMARRERFETAVLSRLRMLPREAFCMAADAEDGLGDRLWKAAREAESLERIYELAKTKRYPMARVRRVCLSIALGIDASFLSRPVPYARILAANEKGCALLRKWKQNPTFPIVIKPSQMHKLPKDCMDVFATGVLAHDLYTLCYPEESQRIGAGDWKNSPVIVKDA